MEITVNGAKKEILNKESLQDIIEGFCKEPKNIIAEVNGTIVKGPLWPQKKIQNGDTIELISIVGGG